MQQDVVAVPRIKGHQCFATIKFLGPSGENISILEDRVVGNGVEMMIAIDMTGQTPLNYVEERVERPEGLVFWIGHLPSTSIAVIFSALCLPARRFPISCHQDNWTIFIRPALKFTKSDARRHG
jgi:hypothetical protein